MDHNASVLSDGKIQYISKWPIFLCSYVPMYLHVHCKINLSIEQYQLTVVLFTRNLE